MNKPKKSQSIELNVKETDKLLPKVTKSNLDVDFIEDEVEEKGLKLSFCYLYMSFLL